jgi:uncharacterized protein (DUF3820 family)
LTVLAPSGSTSRRTPFFLAPGQLLDKLFEITKTLDSPGLEVLIDPIL